MAIMQYANVYVDRKLQKTGKLIYKIPAEFLADIAIGSLVDVPIRGKVTRGIVASFTSHKPGEFAIQSIARIRSTGPVITQKHLDLYEKIAKTSLASLEDVLFYFLPPKIKLVESKIEDHKIKTKQGQIKIIQGTTQERFDRYQKLIEAFDESLIFIFPDMISLNSFANRLPENTFTISTGLDTPKHRWQVWHKTYTEKIVLLTTRIGIGLISNRPTILIIDSPAHPGYKEDRRPKFQIEELIPLRLEIGSKIILGVNFPTLLERYLYNLKIKNQPLKTLITTGQDITSSQIAEKINSDNRTLIIIPQKGQWGLLICKNCREILACDKCHKPLKQVQESLLYCTYCQRNVHGFPACSKCGDHNYTGYSIGATQIQKELLADIKDRPIIRLDKNNPMETKLHLPQRCIVIATHTILDYYIEKFDRVFCLGFDPLLDFTQIDQEEKIAINLYGFLSLGKVGEILTKRPDQRVYHAIASNTLNDLLDTIIIERGQNLPPLTRLVQIESKSSLNTTLLEDLKCFSRIPIKMTERKGKFHVILSINRLDWSRFYTFAIDHTRDLDFNPEPREINL